MTKREPIIRSAQYEDAELRRQCREGTERYRLALIKAGHMTAKKGNDVVHLAKEQSAYIY
jgi:hypothetical protein